MYREFALVQEQIDNDAGSVQPQELTRILCWQHLLGGPRQEQLKQLQRASAMNALKRLGALDDDHEEGGQLVFISTPARKGTAEAEMLTGEQKAEHRRKEKLHLAAHHRFNFVMHGN